VASIYSSILCDLGLLSKGDVLIKNPSDFVGDVLGASAQKTRDILKAAEGGVLVIDEAYSLYSGGLTGSGTNDPYKTDVLDTLVEQVQAKPGDDRVVILLGYREEMEAMLRHTNPGLARRFQLDEAFHFPDYDDHTLLRILKSKVRRMEMNITRVIIQSLGRNCYISQSRLKHYQRQRLQLKVMKLLRSA